ncbi:MAG TPA: sulfatase-like hydrolase/transferase [Caulifigura sp.]|nr:sulfatase-like hydrolase/transferase [Caulifigura sp.]
MSFWFRSLLLCLIALVAATGQAAPPNIVHVLIDDMGYSDLGCYGNKDVKTPNIDRLAAEGLKFTHFYTNAPICSPSRTAWTTGQYPARHRILSFLANREENAKRGMPNWLNPEVWTLADGLHRAGYATGHFGKWHMGGQRDVGEAPLITEYGFDQSLTNFEGLGDRALPLLDAFNGTEPKRYSLGSDKLGRGEITWLNRDEITGAFVKRAAAFIDQAKAAKKPFFVNLWPDDVHSPFFPSKEMADRKMKRRRYLAVAEDMDRQLGVLFDKIRSDAALRDNTIVIVTSDNGPEPGAGSAAPYRGTKGQLYEGGIREPLIVWAPGLIKPAAVGKTNSASWLTAVDVSRSLLAIAGVEVSADRRLDGEDLSSTLLGAAEESRKSPAIWLRPSDRPGPKDAPLPDLAIRDGKWKLLTMSDGSGMQLYDLSADPTEMKNVAADYPDLAGRMNTIVTRWFEEEFKGTFPKRPE